MDECEMCKNRSSDRLLLIVKAAGWANFRIEAINPVFINATVFPRRILVLCTNISSGDDWALA